MELIQEGGRGGSAGVTGPLCGAVIRAKVFEHLNAALYTGRGERRGEEWRRRGGSCH